MAGKWPTKLPDGTWRYPNLAAVLDKVGLKTIAHYFCVRRQHIASYIVNKSIFQTCMDGVRRRGSGVRHFLVGTINGFGDVTGGTHCGAYWQ
jgi:hypothetical protein